MNSSLLTHIAVMVFGIIFTAIINVHTRFAKDADHAISTIKGLVYGLADICIYSFFATSLVFELIQPDIFNKRSFIAMLASSFMLFFRFLNWYFIRLFWRRAT